VVRRKFDCEDEEGVDGEGGKGIRRREGREGGVKVVKIQDTNVPRWRSKHWRKGRETKKEASLREKERGEKVVVIQRALAPSNRASAVLCDNDSSLVRAVD
jgi:hypothetical protein